jgi:hypothetical protein
VIAGGSASARPRGDRCGQSRQDCVAGSAGSGALNASSPWTHASRWPSRSRRVSQRHP